MDDEKRDEILEAILRANEKRLYSLEAIRRDCATAVTEADFLQLECEGLIATHGGQVTLSSRGQGVANGVMRRHRLAEVLLSSILQLKNSELEEVACRAEHYLLPEVEEAICTLLGHPEVCPDGRPIPRGRCCQSGFRLREGLVVSLADLRTGEAGRIFYLKPSADWTVHQIVALGLQPGVTVTVLQTSPAFCVAYEHTEIAMDREIAAHIFVWRTFQAG
ncbi:MAG: metal-dependent transcriptional regulator [Thermodesulfobacteriota bacterium]